MNENLINALIAADADAVEIRISLCRNPASIVVLGKMFLESDVISMKKHVGIEEWNHRRVVDPVEEAVKYIHGSIRQEFIRRFSKNN